MIKVATGLILVLVGTLWLLKELNIIPADLNFWPPFIIFLGLIFLISAFLKKKV